jgi:redox-sensitive bicupin YhaK (pirin superfamily)
MEGFQLWVNLPARLKMTAPRYQDIASENIPEVQLTGGIQVRLIAGHLGDRTGAVTDIYADPNYLDVTLPPEMSFRQNVTAGHNAFAYLFRGAAAFAGGDHLLTAPRLVLFDDGDVVEVKTLDQEARFLLVSGLPLREPIARYGPFVMNTREEIEETLLELREGRFITNSDQR